MDRDQCFVHYHWLHVPNSSVSDITALVTVGTYVWSGAGNGVDSYKSHDFEATCSQITSSGGSLSSLSLVWSVNPIAGDRAVTPPCLQILRINGEEMTDDIIMHGTWCHLWKKKIREKDVVGIVTGVCEETFNINCKNSSNRQNIWNFNVRKSKLQEMANFGNYPGDFRLQSGDQEKWFKIWSLPDYPGELTAVRRKQQAFHDATTVVSLSNDYRNSLLMTCYYPDLDSDASSVQNFCARFSHVILWGNHNGSIAKCQLFSQVINPQEHSKFV